MLRSIHLPILLAGVALPAAAQVNDKGAMHLSLGAFGAGHATRYEQTNYVFGVPFTDSDDDGAASVTFPLEFHYGFAKFFSLGLNIEPGVYLDSSDTQSNTLVLIGLQPRFYLVNSDKFTWIASLQFGSSALKIHNEEGLSQTTHTYRGSHFGLGTGVGFYFSDHFGFMLHARYLANRFELKEAETDGVLQSLDNFDAELTTTGFGLQLSGVFSF